MTEAQAKALNDRNIALQKVVKAVKDCDGKRAIEQCWVAVEKQKIGGTYENLHD